MTGRRETVSVFLLSEDGTQTTSGPSRTAHGVEILGGVRPGGAVDFLVYGYMNRGGREGYTGVSYYRYEAESNTLTEQFFLPAAEPYSELRLDLALPGHKGQNGIFSHVHGRKRLWDRSEQSRVCGGGFGSG